MMRLAISQEAAVVQHLRSALIPSFQNKQERELAANFLGAFNTKGFLNKDGSTNDSNGAVVGHLSECGLELVFRNNR